MGAFKQALRTAFMARIRYSNPNKVRRPLTLAIVTGVIGVLILAAGVWSLNNTRSFMAGAQRVEARVVAMQADRSGKEPSFRPMFAFDDANGQAQRVPGWQSAPEYGFAKDEVVAVLYNPAAPDAVRVDNWRDTWKSGLNILFVAGFFLFMSLAGLIVHRRWMAEQPDYVARGDFVPEDVPDDVIYFNANGRVRLLRNPKPAAIVLGIIGAGMAAAGVYGVSTGADMGGEDQVAAYFVGAAMFLGLALWAALLHRKYQRVRARRAEGKAGP